MARSTRTRRGADDVSGMPRAPDGDDLGRAATPPRVQIGAAEKELATRTRLLCGEHPLGSQATNAVPVDSEVLGGRACVEPLVGGPAFVPREPVDDLGSDEIGQLRQ